MQQGSHQRSPVRHGSLLSDPVDAQGVVPAVDEAPGARAAQYLDDIGAAEAFAALRETRDAGQELSRVHAAVPHGPRFAAVVACSAGTGKRLIEVMQLNGAAALGRFRIVQDLAQLLARDSLFILERRAGILIDLLLNEKLGGADIGGAEIESAARGIAVAAGAARFLIVAFEALGQVVVNHPADVRFVDAHSEGDGRDDHLHIVANERFLIVAPGLRLESGVTGSRRSRRPLRAPAPASHCNCAWFSGARGRTGWGG